MSKGPPPIQNCNSQGGLVLGTTAWGILVMRMQIVRRSGVKVFNPLVEGAMVATFVWPISDLVGYKVSKAEVHSPVGFAALANDPGASMRVEVTIGPVRTIEEAAAEDGFRCLQATHLEKFAAYRKMRFSKQSRPKREADWVLALIGDILPNASDELKAKAMEARSMKTYDETRSLLCDTNNLDVIELGLEDDDFQEVKKVSKALAKEKEKRETSKKAAVATSASTSKASGKKGTADEEGRTWHLRPLPSHDEDVSLEQARTFLPKVVGCTLSKDIKRFSRWSCKYPRSCPPCNVTKSWGPMSGESVSSALSVVLKQVWAWHTSETGEACPLQFD